MKKQKEKITFVMSEGSSEVTVINDYANGISKKRILSIMDVARAFNSMVEEQGVNGNLLEQMPKGYLNAAYQSPGNFKVWIALEETKRSMLYYGKAEYIPFPGLIFELEVMNSKVVTSNLFSYIGTAKEGMKLYNYPFGNVYDEGKICWGNMNLPAIMTLKDTEKIINMFLASETNNDLFRNRKFQTQRALIEDIKDKDLFPKEYLTDSGKILHFC